MVHWCSKIILNICVIISRHSASVIAYYRDHTIYWYYYYRCHSIWYHTDNYIYKSGGTPVKLSWKNIWRSFKKTDDRNEKVQFSMSKTWRSSLIRNCAEITFSLPITFKTINYCDIFLSGKKVVYFKIHCLNIKSSKLIRKVLKTTFL